MSEILLIRTMTGYAPADDEAQEVAKKHKLGSILRGDFSVMRNGAFFRKWWALVKLGFDYFEETCQTQEYKGKPVLANFERFRKDITIMTGFYHPVWNLNGEMRIEADSLKWSKMTETEFTKLYDATIKVMLQKVFKNSKWDEQTLRNAVEQVMEFAQ